ncbi:MAG: putative rane protein [Chthoniobacter sp.]|jgi:putative membrane protein|nr:putative rane protein [Chthoniobacter sp.]
MKTFSFLTALALAVTTTCAYAADAAVERPDKSFITNAYEDGLAEVKLGEMAQGKSGNADVKAFGGHMATDHGKASAELKALADSKKVEVATDVTMVAKGKAKLLDAKSGADFDKAYAEAMVTDHKKAVKAFEKASNEAKDADVKAFAAKTLPTLTSHLSMAEELQKKVGK